MYNKNGGSKIPYVAFIALLALGALLSVGLFRYVKEVQVESEKEKAVFIKKNAELTSVNKKMEKEFQSLEDSMILIESKNRVVLKQKEALKKENIFLRKDIKAIKAKPLTKLLEEALAVESNENIKKVMQQAIEKIDMIKSGKVVNLEPILITEKGAALPEEPKKVIQIPVSTGTILSIDRKNNLIAINLGEKNDVKEGERYAIFRGDKELGSAEIISVRQKVSAAVIDDIKPLHTINDIEKGDGVILRN